MTHFQTRDTKILEDSFVPLVFGDNITFVVLWNSSLETNK